VCAASVARTCTPVVKVDAALACEHVLAVSDAQHSDVDVELLTKLSSLQGGAVANRYTRVIHTV
jgi:hypothetical protein